MATGVVSINSDLIRRKWIVEGLIQAQHKSFFSPFIGNSKESVVYKEVNTSADSGHTIVFDFDGNLSGKPIKGKNQAYGHGEEKRKFSDKLTVERYRFVVDNGDKFDGKNIGDLSLMEHAQSREMLADLFMRWRDQIMFDALQGVFEDPTHIIDLGTTFNYDSLITIENIVKTGTGYTTGGSRRPLVPYQTADGQPVWILVIDNYMKKALLQDTDFQRIVSQADVRGNGNMLIKGVVGRIGSLLIIEAGTYFGTTDSDIGSIELSDISVEIPGLRRWDSSGNPSGTPSFNESDTHMKSRALLLGKGALMYGLGKLPDYKIQQSIDFGIISESCLEVWLGLKKTKLVAENTDYDKAKVADIDWGVVAIDVEVS